MVPHDPYIFSPSGEYISEEQDMETGYVTSTKFINNELLSIVEEILHNSEEQPVIIIMSDHGWPLIPAESRMPIVTAVYLPNQKEIGLYENITPVNIFRLIFNSFLNTDFEKLEDVSIYTDDLRKEFEDGEIYIDNCEKGLAVP